MSEELQSKYQKNKKIIGQIFGEFEYFQIGSTTFGQLKRANIIPGNYDKAFDIYKPDRLIVDRRGVKPSIIAVIEDKRSGKFNSEAEKISAIQQCNNYSQELGAKMGIITDGSITIWINPQEKNKNTEYQDTVIGKKRSYTLIKKENGEQIIKSFQISEKQDLLDPEKMNDETKTLYKYIKEISRKINNKNSVIKEPKRIDPLPLARRVWQDIWVATGKSPEKCLYNVVELFIFKFLSDLKVLEEPQNFEYLLKLIDTRSHKDVLDHYAKICRPKIKELFPSSVDDGTTIINGTIFVNEKGDANLGQAILFCNSLKKFKDFEKEQGTFEHIDKNFKTKLFETFLKQSEGQKALGQYFTPRKIVQAIVRMSGVEKLKQGARFCDPFCGVGGFILEPINLFRINDFEPKNNRISPPIEYLGFDKGFEKDEERTIILAKANMLLYLTEIISKNPSLTKQFAEVFNKVFRLWQSNLGTLEHIFEEEKEKFDLILTNPPYVTSGSGTLKNEIMENADLNNFYSINAGGVEGLGLEWVIRSLKKGGKAFVVVPDGILNRLNDKKIRRFILDECYLDAIISLPVKTFFSTPKKTYILAITKKEVKEDKQNFPVLTYLVSNVGETLDVNRFEIPENDLVEMIDLFNQFAGIKNSPSLKKILESQSKRCKIQSLEKFDPEKHWSVDRWWNKEEKIELGIEEEEQEINGEDFFNLISETVDELKNISKQGNEILKKKFKKQTNIKFKTVSLSDEHFFNLAIGKRLLKKDLFHSRNDQKIKIPAYSANIFTPFGYVAKSNISKFDNPYIIWGIDGNFDLTCKNKGEVFASTDHCGTIEILDKNIDSEFLLIGLYLKKIEYGFDRGLRANLVNVKRVEINIPIDRNDNFDLDLQKELVLQNQEVKNIQNKIRELKEKIENIKISFSEEFEGKNVRIVDLYDEIPVTFKYTKETANQNKGEFPLFSSQFLNEGLCGRVSKASFFECSNKNTYLTFGDHTKSVFVRREPFAVMDNVKVLKLKQEFINIVDEDFVIYSWKGVMPNLGYSRHWKEANKNKFKIPVKKNGEFDLEKQKEIVRRYEKVEELKKELTEKLESLANYKITL